MLRGTHPFIVVAVGFGSLVIFVNLVMIARGIKVQRGLLCAITVFTLAASTMLGKGAI